MKKFIILIALFLVGCADPNSAYQKIRTAYPKGEIANIPGHSGEFLVRTADGAILFIKRDGNEFENIALNPTELFLPK